MKTYAEQPEEVKKFFERKTAEEVIKRYLAIQIMEDAQREEVNRIKIANCQKLYNALDTKLRAECEAEIKKDIEEGKLNLDNYITKLKRVKRDGEER